MKNLLKSMTIGLALMGGPILMAQNDPQLSQFMAHKLYYNPAGTGFDDLFHASLTYRDQWLGSSAIAKGDRPRYMLLNASQFLWDQRSGFGLSVMDGRQSVSHDFQAKISYAYHLQVQDEAFLAFGISAGAVGRSIRGSETAAGNDMDFKNHFLSDLGAGLEFYMPELVVGFGVNHIPLYFGDEQARMHAHFYYYMTYVYQINDDWKLIPSVMLRNSSFITNFDVNLRVAYLNRFMIGASYRLDAMAFSAAINITKNFTISYSIDLNLGVLQKGGYKPSHEFVLSYRGLLVNKKQSYERVADPSGI